MQKKNINPNSDLLKLKDLSTLWSYKKLVAHVDQPIPFDGRDSGLWRYNGVRYGSFFDKHLCNHVVFFHMGLKKNIGLLMPFLTNLKFNKPKSIKRFNFWPKSAFIYESSFVPYKSEPLSENFTNSNLYPVNNLSFNLAFSINSYYARDFIGLWILGISTLIAQFLIITQIEKAVKK
jgi:hypothetical protein